MKLSTIIESDLSEELGEIVIKSSNITGDVLTHKIDLFKELFGRNPVIWISGDWNDVVGNRMNLGNDLRYPLKVRDVEKTYFVAKNVKFPLPNKTNALIIFR